MFSASDYAGVVPYGYECEAQVVKLLPEGTYLRLNYPRPRLVRLTASFDPVLRCAMIEFQDTAMHFVLDNETSVVPLTDAEALGTMPLGTKVKMHITDPSRGGGLYRIEGFVTQHLQRRVRVSFSYFDGTPGERDFYVTQLRV